MLVSPPNMTGGNGSSKSYFRSLRFTLLKLLSAVNATAAQLRCGTVGHGQGLDSRGAVEAAVLLEHRLDLSMCNSVLGRPLPLRLLPPGVVSAAGHAQLPAQPAHGEAIHQVVDQAKPLGDSCSFAKRAAANLKNPSVLSSRFSLRSWASSALSSLVS